MLGWYFDLVIGYLIRTVIRMVKTRGSDFWTVEKGLVSASTCPAATYGGPVAEVSYTYNYEGGYFAGIHQKPFILRGSAEDYAAQFPAGSEVFVRVKPEQPQTSVVCDEDQTARVLGLP
jgi:hypothetical protein